MKKYDIKAILTGNDENEKFKLLHDLRFKGYVIKKISPNEVIIKKDNKEYIFE